MNNENKHNNRRAEKPVQDFPKMAQIINANINKRKMMRLSERVSVGTSFHKILNEIKETENIKIKDLAKHCFNKKYEEESYNKLFYKYQIPSNLKEADIKKRAEKLTQNAKKYIDIINKIAVFTKLNADELIYRVFEQTDYINQISNNDLYEENPYQEISFLLNRMADHLVKKYDLVKFFKDTSKCAGKYSVVDNKILNINSHELNIYEGYIGCSNYSNIDNVGNCYCKDSPLSPSIFLFYEHLINPIETKALISKKTAQLEKEKYEEIDIKVHLDREVYLTILPKTSSRDIGLCFETRYSSLYSHNNKIIYKTYEHSYDPFITLIKKTDNKNYCIELPSIYNIIKQPDYSLNENDFWISDENNIKLFKTIHGVELHYFGYELVTPNTCKANLSINKFTKPFSKDYCPIDYRIANSPYGTFATVLESNISKPKEDPERIDNLLIADIEQKKQMLEEHKNKLKKKRENIHSRLINEWS